MFWSYCSDGRSLEPYQQQVWSKRRKLFCQFFVNQPSTSTGDEIEQSATGDSETEGEANKTSQQQQPVGSQVASQANSNPHLDDGASLIQFQQKQTHDEVTDTSQTEALPLSRPTTRAVEVAPGSSKSQQRTTGSSSGSNHNQEITEVRLTLEQLLDRAFFRFIETTVSIACSGDFCVLRWFLLFIVLNFFGSQSVLS